MHRLSPHPNTPPKTVSGIEVEITSTDTDLFLKFWVLDALHMVLPQPASPMRCDGLWQKTCFELFVKPINALSYFEFNFSPSTEWAAYSFEDYRSGMNNLAKAVTPHIETASEQDRFTIEIDLELDEIPMCELSLALSAVIEEKDGTKSYWALNHPPGKPDFHHPDCFVLTLPAPG